ncbi:hypothetical protein ACFOD4_13215 [Pseudoroseomonas globiformis]|uniref:Phasin family protein n=1 Tax=Teichococcus globiformis TaxID=2307229 RepID=A0ABV7G4S9_9PROT
MARAVQVFKDNMIRAQQRAADQVRELSRQSESLGAEVKTFLADVRSA